MMNNRPKIEFVLRDKVDGVEITPATIGLSRFNEFNQQVEAFIAGSGHLKLDGVHPTVASGSYKLIVGLTLAVAAALEPDLRALQRQDGLGEIDARRADVVAKWQARAKGKPDVRYTIRPSGIQAGTIELSTATDYRAGEYDPWVKVEKYFFGTVLDMGGKKSANVHVQLEGTDQIMVAATSQDYLRQQKTNLLYHKVLVRIEAQQHHRTGQLRNLRLISFEDYRPRFDEAALDRFADAGSSAWKDVASPGKWVTKLRGGS